MKKTVYLLIFILLASVSCFPASAAEKVDSDVDRKAKVLADLGILEEETFEDGTMTRGEFAGLVIKMMNVDTGAFTSVFRDTDENEYAEAVAAVSSMGYMTGYGDDTFGVDDAVTYIQVIKTLICMAGYEPMAYIRGGFPTGFLTVAYSEKIVRLKTADVNAAATYGDVISMLYDLLSVKVLREAVTGENVEYVYSGLFHYEKLGLVSGKGVVMANSLCNLVDERALGKNELLVGSAVVEAPDVDVSDYLGRYVEYFMDEEEQEVVSLWRDDTELDTLEIDAADIISCDARTMQYMDENGMGRTARISQNAQTIYNGRLLYSPAEADFKPEEGSVRLVAVNGGGYDLAVITSLQSLIVEEAGETAEGWLIRFSNGDSAAGTDRIEIGKGSKGKNIRVVLNGAISTASSISKGMVVDAAAEKYPAALGLSGVEAATLYVSAVTAAGTVNAKGEQTITIGETEYDLSPGFDRAELASLRVGEAITGYINTKGRLVGYEMKTGASEQYYYLLGVEKISPMSSQARLKTVTPEGKISVLECNESVSFEGYFGEAYRQARVKAEKLPDLLSVGGIVKQQLLKIGLDADGFISKVSSAYEDAANQMPGYADEGFRLSAQWTGANGARIYQDKVNSINSNYTLDGSTLVFYLAGNAQTEDDVKVGNNSILPQDKTYSNLKVYDATPLLNAGVVVIIEEQLTGQTPDEATCKSNVVVVENVSQCIIGTDKETYRLTGWQNGEKVTLTASSERLADSRLTRWANIDGKNDETAKFKNLKRGDIIQYKVDGDGYVDTLHILFYYSQWRYAEYVNGDTLDDEHHRAMIHTAFGEVEMRPNPDLLWIKSQYKAKAYPIDKASITVYDMKTHRIYKGTAFDISAGDKVFVRDMAYLVVDVIVFKNFS